MKEKFEQPQKSKIMKTGNPEVNTENFEAKAARFSEYFPSGKIEKIALADLPPAALDYFEQRSHFLVDIRKYRAENFLNLFVITHDNGDRTYVANQIKDMGREENNIIDEWIFFLTMRGDEKIIHGDVVNLIEANRANCKGGKNKPFVFSLFLERDENYQYKPKREGNGEALVDIMNATTQAFHQLPLYFDTNELPDGREFLKRLCEKGKLREFKEPVYEEDRITGRLRKIKELDSYVYADKLKSKK